MYKNYKNRGFSAFFLIIIVAVAIFLTGAFESVQTINPTQAIPDPNNTKDTTGKESLQLKTIGFITISPPPIATVTNEPTSLHPSISPTLSISPYSFPPAIDSSWHLVFSDDFNGTNLDISQWSKDSQRGTPCQNVDPGGDACFDPSAISVNSGNAHIESNRQEIGGYPYLGGIINTTPHHYFTYGYFEARAKLVKGNGFWSAIWLYSSVLDANEIDIIELLGKDPMIAHQTFHAINVPQTQFNSGGTDWTKDYHIWAVKWQPGLVIFYIDNVERGRVTTNIPSEKMNFMMNLDVGNNNAWSGPADGSTTFPSYMDIDWIHVYQQSGMYMSTN